LQKKQRGLQALLNCPERELISVSNLRPEHIFLQGSFSRVDSHHSFPFSMNAKHPRLYPSGFIARINRLLFSPLFPLKTLETRKKTINLQKFIVNCQNVE